MRYRMGDVFIVTDVREENYSVYACEDFTALPMWVQHSFSWRSANVYDRMTDSYDLMVCATYIQGAGKHPHFISRSVSR